jgi:hypothetical protein
LKLFLQFEAMSMDELGQGDACDLGLAGKPASPDKLFDLSGQLLGDVDLERFQGRYPPWLILAEVEGTPESAHWGTPAPGTGAEGAGVR